MKRHLNKYNAAILCLGFLTVTLTGFSYDLFVQNNEKQVELSELNSSIQNYQEDISEVESQKSELTSEKQELSSKLEKEKNQATIITEIGQFYETYDHNAAFDVLVYNTGAEQATNVVGICGISNPDMEYIDAFHIDLENIAGNQFELRTFEVETDDVSNYHGIECFTYDCKDCKKPVQNIPSIQDKIDQMEKLDIPYEVIEIKEV